MLRPDLVAEEPRRLAGGVGDQSLGLGKLQLELIAQELTDLRLDLLRFAPRTGKPEEKIVAIPHIPKPPVAGIVRVLARQTTTQATKRPHRIPVCVPFSLRDPAFNAMVSGFASTLATSGIFRYQLLFNELVEPVQVNVRQHGTSDPALRSTGVRRIPLPVLQVPGLEHPVD